MVLNVFDCLLASLGPFRVLYVIDMTPFITFSAGFYSWHTIFLFPKAFVIRISTKCFQIVVLSSYTLVTTWTSFVFLSKFTSMIRMSFTELYKKILSK